MLLIAGIWLSLGGGVYAEPQGRASEWFASSSEGTEIVQIGTRQATRHVYFLMGGVVILSLGIMGVLVWQQRTREQAMLKRLRDTEERLQEAQAIAGIGSWTRDFATGETYWSPEARELLMLGDDPKKWSHYETYVHPEDQGQVIEAIARAYCRGGVYHIDHRLVCPTGVIKHVRLVGRVFLNGHGRAAVFEHGTVQDISERKLIEIHLRDNEEKLRAILDGAPIALMIFELGESFSLRFANPAACRLFGWPPNFDLASINPSVHWLSVEALSQFKTAVMNTDEIVKIEAMLRKTDGAVFSGALKAQVTRYGRERAILVCVRDNSDQRALLEELEKRATLDPLTGVLNSHSFNDLAIKEFRRALRYSQSVAICVLVVDQMRSISEGFGSAAADVLLQQFVDLLQDAVRVEDSIGRISRDEFAILLVGATTEGGRLVAERIRKMCEDEAFELHRQSLHLTLSLGVASLEASRDSVETVMSRALDTLQNARRIGGNCVVLQSTTSLELQKKA